MESIDIDFGWSEKPLTSLGEARALSPHIF